MNELTFINAVLNEADCHLHLDVNNLIPLLAELLGEVERIRVLQWRHTDDCRFQDISGAAA